MSKTTLDIHALMELFLRHYIRCMTKAVKDLGYGGAPQDMRVLFLSMKDPGISISQIVDEMGRDKSQITRKVKDLEKKGLLIRKPHEDDKRVSTLYLTKEGEKIAVELNKIKQNVLDEVLSPLNKNEKQQFQRVLEIIVEDAYDA